MQMPDLGLVVFGAILTWVYSALRDYRKAEQERKSLLISLHNEIKQIRVATIRPTYQPNALFNWPYIDSALITACLQSHYISPTKDRSILGIMVLVLKHIGEYNRFHTVAHMIIANSLEKHCYEPNHKDMHSGLDGALERMLSILQKADFELSKVTKNPVLEDELKNTLHTQLAQGPSQSAKIPSDQAPSQ